VVFSIHARRGHALHAVRLLSFHSICIHRLTASTNRLQLQVDRGGGRGVNVFTTDLVLASAVKSTVHGLLSVALHVHSAGLLGQRRLFADSRFLRESSRFHSREIGNENVWESRAPGKREPGNGNTKCWCRISLKLDVVCQSYGNVYSVIVFSWTRCRM